jgi:formylglycine-generating enzyme required for sulfatase activity
MWFCANSGDTSQPVRGLHPNAFGLYDMLGNVGEWCEDFIHSSYTGAPTDGSPWLNSQGSDGGLRVIRGGSRHFNASRCRSASRIGNNPAAAFGDTGFRVVRQP